MPWYGLEFKKEALRLLETRGRSVLSVANELGEQLKEGNLKEEVRRLRREKKRLPSVSQRT